MHVERAHLRPRCLLPHAVAMTARYVFAPVGLSKVQPCPAIHPLSIVIHPKLCTLSQWIVGALSSKASVVTRIGNYLLPRGVCGGRRNNLKKAAADL